MTQENYTLKPTVDPAQEFIEIAYDFSNPLDLVREGISNGFALRKTYFCKSGRFPEIAPTICSARI